MSTNMIYQGNTRSSQAILLHQTNPAYIKASDIHIYDEIPGGQYEEIPAVTETNLHNNDNYANQGNQEDQDNGSYVSQVNQEDQDNGSYVSQMNQEDQDNGSYVSQVNQEDQDNGSYVSQGNQDDQDNEDSEGYVDTGVIDDIAQSQEDKGSYENIPKVDNDDYI